MTTKKLVTLSLVATIYVVLTLAIAPLAYGPLQFRISEILNLLAFYNPIYGVAITLGCFIANMFTPNLPLLDLIFGTLATALSVFFISKSRNLLIASIFPTIINAIIIPWVITASISGDLLFFISNPIISDSDFSQNSANILYCLYALSIALGEFVVVTIIGVPLFKYLENKQSAFIQMLKDL